LVLCPATSSRRNGINALNRVFALVTAGTVRTALPFSAALPLFKQKPSDADMDWVVAEMMKTPIWIAEAAYSDFVMSDYAKSLPAIEVPVIVFAANSEVFFRHAEIYRSDGTPAMTRSGPKTAPRTIGFDESPAGYSLASCSPAELAAASPAEDDS
jgi:hypothetical protein